MNTNKNGVVHRETMFIDNTWSKGFFVNISIPHLRLRYYVFAIQ